MEQIREILYVSAPDARGSKLAVRSERIGAGGHAISCRVVKETTPGQWRKDKIKAQDATRSFMRGFAFPPPVFFQRTPPPLA